MFGTSDQDVPSAFHARQISTNEKEREIARQNSFDEKHEKNVFKKNLKTIGTEIRKRAAKGEFNTYTDVISCDHSDGELSYERCVKVHDKIVSHLKSCGYNVSRNRPPRARYGKVYIGNIKW